MEKPVGEKYLKGRLEVNFLIERILCAKTRIGFGDQDHNLRRRGLQPGHSVIGAGVIRDDYPGLGALRGFDNGSDIFGNQFFSVIVGNDRVNLWIIHPSAPGPRI